MKQYVGLVGSNKEELAINDMIKESKEKKYKKIYLLVPDFKTYEYEKKLVNLLGGTNTSIEILSFNRLPNLIFKNTKYMNTMYINEVSRKLYLKNIISKLELKLLKNEKNLDDISNLISKFMQNGISVEDLKGKYREILTSSKSDIFKAKLEDIIKIMEAYVLKIDKFNDIDQKSQILKQAIQSSDVLKNTKFYVMEFSSLSLNQIEILKEIVKKTDDITTTITLDNIGSKNDLFKSSLNIFNVVLNSSTSDEKNVEKCEEVFRKGKIKLLSNILVNSFSKIEISENSNLDLEEDNISIFKYDKKTDEIKGIVSKIYTDLKNGYKENDIQLLVNDITSKKHFLEKEFQKYGISINALNDKKLEDSDLVKFVINLLSVINLNVNDIIRFLKSKVFKNLYINHLKNINKSEQENINEKEKLLIEYEKHLFKFEKYLIRWNIGRKNILNSFKYGKKAFNGDINQSFYQILSFKNMFFGFLDQIIKFILEENNEDKEEFGLENGKIFFPYLISAFKSEEDFKTNIKNIEKAETEVLTSIKSSLKKLKKNNFTSTDFSKRIYNLLVSAKVFEASDPIQDDNTLDVYDDKISEYESSINLFIQTLDDLVDEEEISYSEYISRFNLAIENKKINSLPKNLSIQVSEVKYAKTNCKKTYIMSMEEDITPSISERVGIISEKENLELKKLNIVLYKTFEEIEASNNMEMYLALMSAKEELVLSFSKYDDIEQSDLSPSTYLTEISKLLKVNIIEEDFDYIKSFLGKTLLDYINEEISKVKEKDIDRYNILKNIINELPNTEFALKMLDISCFNTMQNIMLNSNNTIKQDKNNNQNDEENNILPLNVLEFIFNNLTTSTGFKKIYTEALRKNIPDNLPVDILEKIYKKNIAMSVSKLESYASFPFTYHLKYILKIGEERKFKIDALDTGDFIHNVIENVFNEIKKVLDSPNEISDKNLKKLYEDQKLLPNLPYIELIKESYRNDETKIALNDYLKSVKALVDSKLNETLKDSKYEVFTSTKKNEKLISKLKNNLHDICLGVLETLRLSEYKILGNEVVIGLNKDEDNNSIKIPEGEYIVKNHIAYLNGKIDRVDISKDEKDIRIIDYKSSNHDLDYEKIINGLQLQLIVYSSIIEKVLNKKSKGLLYFNANKKIKTIKSKSDINVNIPTFMNGYIIGTDAEDLNQMDLSLEAGKNSSIIPVKLNKDSSISKVSKVFNEADYEDLKSKAESKIENLISKIVEGDVSITPYRYVQGNTSKESALTYCPYKLIHKFKVGENKYNYIIKNKSEKFTEKEIKKMDKTSDYIEED